MSTPSTLKMTLRSASLTDREFLWWLHRATMLEYVDKTWGWDEKWQRERFDQGLDPTSMQIIEIDQKAVGYMLVERKPDVIFLASIEVAPEFQNRGIATGLILELFREADQSQKPLRLQVLKVNRARRLYERLGFECVEETKTHFVMKRSPATITNR